LAEDKIPVLTEVYRPKAVAKEKSDAANVTEVTADLVAKVTAQVKPRLESEITEFVLDELKSEIKKAHSDIVASTQNFVDKTKADLKTELPQMYQESVKLAQVDIDALKQATLDQVLIAIRKEMVDFQESIVKEHQQQINETLEAIAKRAEGSASEQIGIMHSRVGTMQQEAFTKLREEFTAEKDTMLNAAKTEIKTTFSNQMTAGQEKLKENIEATLNRALPGLESRLHAQLVTELQQLLLKVKFVLPE
jgi:vacuolar-type H+-ATPase subunit H